MRFRSRKCLRTQYINVKESCHGQNAGEGCPPACGKKLTRRDFHRHAQAVHSFSTGIAQGYAQGYAQGGKMPAAARLCKSRVRR